SWGGSGVLLVHSGLGIDLMPHGVSVPQQSMAIAPAAVIGFSLRAAHLVSGFSPPWRRSLPYACGSRNGHCTRLSLTSPRGQASAPNFSWAFRRPWHPRLLLLSHTGWWNELKRQQHPATARY